MKPLTKEQIKFLNNVCNGTWEQTKKGIYVDGNVNLYNLCLEKIPIKFYKVDGHFDCSTNKLISLEGCPEYVGGDFYFYNNNLTSLEGCPEYVGGYFDCNNNKLTSLEGSPEYVGGNFWCINNNLISLEGIGEVKGKIYCANNKINFKREKELRLEVYRKIQLSTLEKMLLTETY